MGKLVARKYPTPLFLKLADHTYVECGNGARGWSCWGGKSGGMAFHDGVGSTRRANAIAEPDERAGITCYLINGVCHQAANRILLPARILVTGARGYGVSEALFGPYGRPRGFLFFCRAPFNKHENVTGDLSKCTEGTAAAAGAEGPPTPEEQKYVDMVADAYARKGTSSMMTAESDDPKELLASITSFQVQLFSMMMEYRLGSSMAASTGFNEMIAHRTQTETNRFAIEEDFAGGQMKADEFALRLNDEFVEFQRRSANTLGEADYQRLFGVSRDDEIWLGNPDITSAAYSNIDESK